MKENELIEIIKGKALKKQDGRYYYRVPSAVRRNCKKIVSRIKIEALIRKGIISIDELP